METPSSPGWYDDPQDPTQLRYFDGVVWSSHTTPRSTRSTGAAATSTEQDTSPAPASPQFPGTPAQQSWNTPPAGPQLGQQGQWGQGQQWGQYGQAWGQPTAPDGQPLASYWQRVGAFLIDWIIQSVLSGILGSVFLLRALSPYLDELSRQMDQVESGGQLDMTRLVDSLDLGSLTGYTLVSIAVFAAYQGFFLARLGRTPGKMMCNIHVRELARPGVPSPAAVLRRVGFAVVLFLLQLVPLLGTLVGLARVLDLLWPAWDARRQALHDKVAGTVVVVGKPPRG